MKKGLLTVLLLWGVSACSDAPTATMQSSRLTPEANPTRDAQAAPIPNAYIVRFFDNDPNVLAHAQAIERTHGASIKHVYVAALKGAAFNIADAAAEALRADASVMSVEQDQTMHVNTTQTNPTWGIDRVDQRNLPLSNSYTYGLSGTGVTVYIIDTGINYTHNEFGGRAIKGIDEVTPGGTAADCYGHGSHVAGTVGGSLYGVAKNVRLVSVRVLDCSGSGSTSGVVAGIDWVTLNATRPAVANMSLGGSFSSSLNQAVENSIASGVVYAIAAGNSAANACNESPGSSPSAITVGATDITDRFASFSNFGTCVRINAPGVNITSAWIGSNTAIMTISGTSMATPHVAGASALYLQAFPAATPAQVRSALVGNATANVLTSVPAATPNLLLYTGFLNIAPVANFTSSCASSSCSFDGSTTTALPQATYSWTFGDATPGGTGKTVNHVYAAAGTYSVTLTVTDLNGSSTKTASVTVTSGNQAPVARFTTSCAALTCSVNASTSSDDVGVVSYTWNFGDGSPLQTHGAPTTSRTYAAAGTYTVTLTVTDGGGLTNTTSQQVTVSGGTGNQAPVARFTISCAALTCSVNASTSSDDVGVVSYTWNFGDGSPLQTHGAPTTSRTYAAAGTYTVTLTVTDGGGLTNTTSQQVTVSGGTGNQAPVARFTMTCPTRSCSADASTSSDDVGVVSYTWNWGDGTPSATHGGANTTKTYAVAGTYTVTLTVTDAGGLTNTTSQQVTVP